MALDRFIVLFVFVFSSLARHQFHQDPSFSELTPYAFLFSTSAKQQSAFKNIEYGIIIK